MDITDRINQEAAALAKRAAESGKPIAELSLATHVLALALFLEKAMPCTEPTRCFDREEKRLKGYPTLPSSAINRAWSCFDPQKLCNHCRPYWYVEMGAMEMRSCAHFEAVLAEEKKNKENS